MRSILERFEEKYIPEPNSGCWLWTASVNGDGYGQFFVGKKVLAHRASWSMVYGDIPESTCVLHHCDQPSCVNPDHLFLGSKKDNSHDMMKKGRTTVLGMIGDDHPTAKLTEKEVLVIRKDPRLQRVIAAEYGVTQSLISAVKLKRYWSHI